MPLPLPQSDPTPPIADADIPPDLERAGAVVEKAIDYMTEQQIVPISIASALLGGAMGLLARTLDNAAILQILRNAMNAVESGELRRAEAGEAELPVLPAQPGPN
jgi:hypothetical protein